MCDEIPTNLLTTTPYPRVRREMNIHWSVNAAFAVHNNMRGHTEAHMTLGQGTVVSISTKQKLITQSSTESDLAGVNEPPPNDAMVQALCNWSTHEY